MVAVIVTAPVLLFLIYAEHLRRIRKLKGETTRKFVHIAVGTFVATWPFYLSKQSIQLACLAFFVVILASRYFDIFPSIHKVNRKTWGDLLFPVGIAATLFLADSPWIFSAAILHLALADGLAALVGCRFGMDHKFKVFGYTKTWLGTYVFWLMSSLIIAWLIWLTPAGLYDSGWVLLATLPIIATGVELISTKGTDNLFVPLVVTIGLNYFVALV